MNQYTLSYLRCFHSIFPTGMNTKGRMCPHQRRPTIPYRLSLVNLRNRQQWRALRLQCTRLHQSISRAGPHAQGRQSQRASTPSSQEERVWQTTLLMNSEPLRLVSSSGRLVRLACRMPNS